MKKTLLLLNIIFSCLLGMAQSVECYGAYTVVEPKQDIYTKDCSVCVNEQYAEICLFDTEVVVSVYKHEHMNMNNFCGNIYYIDDSLTSYIFYGDSDDLSLCMVSLVSDDGRWTFVRHIKNEQDEKGDICETN